MERSGFFDGDNEYGQDELGRIFDNMFEPGIKVNEDKALTFRPSRSGTNISIESGFALVKGFYLYMDSIKNFTIAKDNTYDRKDRIVIRYSVSNKKVSVEYKKGVAQSKPSAPVLQRDNLIFELSICTLDVKINGDIVINDERHVPELCGVIRPKNLTEFNAMIDAFNKKFDEWFNNQVTKGWRNIFIQSSRPTNPPEGSIWIETLI